MSFKDYPDTDKVMACLNEVKDAVQSIAEFDGRCIMVFSEDNALDQLKGLKNWPAAVIQYEGMRSVPEPGMSMKIGASVELFLSIMVINQGTSIVSKDTKDMTIRALTALRRLFLGKKSPSGHRWRFVIEAAAAEKNGMVFWVQRWSTPLQLQVVVQE